MTECERTERLRGRIKLGMLTQCQGSSEGTNTVKSHCDKELYLIYSSTVQPST